MRINGSVVLTRGASQGCEYRYFSTDGDPVQIKIMTWIRIRYYYVKNGHCLIQMIFTYCIWIPVSYTSRSYGIRKPDIKVFIERNIL